MLWKRGITLPLYFPPGGPAILGVFSFQCLAPAKSGQKATKSVSFGVLEKEQKGLAMRPWTGLSAPPHEQTYARTAQVGQTVVTRFTTKICSYHPLHCKICPRRPELPKRQPTFQWKRYALPFPCNLCPYPDSSQSSCSSRGLNISGLPLFLPGPALREAPFNKPFFGDGPGH